MARQGAEAARLRRELTGLLQRRERLARRLRSLRGFGDYLRGVLARTGQVSTGGSLSCGAILCVPKVPCQGPTPSRAAAPAASQPPPAAQFQDVPAMLAHFGVLAGVRAALAQQAEAGQERLAQGWARLRRYQEEASSELLRTKSELAQLRAHLEATRHDVLQRVRGGREVPKDPPRDRGSSLDPKRAAEGRCPTQQWWEARWHPLG